jgi:hypothetical protein
MEPRTTGVARDPMSSWSFSAYKTQELAKKKQNKTKTGVKWLESPTHSLEKVLFKHRL